MSCQWRSQGGDTGGPTPLTNDDKCLFLLAVKFNFVLDTQLILKNRELLNKYEIRTEVVLLMYSKMKKVQLRLKLLV